MATTTENLSLTIDTDADDVDINVIGQNFKKLDALGERYATQAGTSGNWDYVKYSDGTAECWMDISTTVATTRTSGAGYRSAQNTAFNFPVTFSSPPMVVCSPVSGSHTLWASLVSVTTTGFSMYYMSFDNTTHTGASCNVHVYGKVGA